MSGDTGRPVERWGEGTPLPSEVLRKLVGRLNRDVAELDSLVEACSALEPTQRLMETCAAVLRSCATELKNAEGDIGFIESQGVTGTVAWQAISDVLVQTLVERRRHRG